MIDRKTFKDIRVSRLGLGTMRLPCVGDLKREANPKIDYVKSQEIVDLAYKSGVNYFDTAYMYHCGKSEAFIGSALKKYPRNSYYLADKLPIWLCESPNDMHKIFEEQLNRCQVDYFDFYLLHSLDEENIAKCQEFEAYQFVKEQKTKGKIKNLGFSFHGTVNDLNYLVKNYEWDFAQIQFNYLDYENQNAKEQYEILTQAGIPVIIMEPVRGGKLAVPGQKVEKLFKAYNNSSIASWAIKFCASFDNVLTILSGMNSNEQMLDNIKSLTDFKALDDNELKLCFEAAKIINKSNLIPCTGCDYCSICPMNIKISSIFNIYNKHKEGELSKAECLDAYSLVKPNHLSCVGCSKCKSVCPQSINIPELFDSSIKIFFQ